MAVSLGKAAILQVAGETRATLLAEMQGSSSVEIDCSELVEADLSLLQLLCAARKLAERDGTLLTVTGPVGTVLGGLAQRVGFAGDPDQAWQAFWQVAGTRQ